jgi:hypothetical protein
MVTTGNEYEDIYQSWYNGNREYVRTIISEKSAKYVVGLIRYLCQTGIPSETAITEVSKMVN